MYDVCTNGEWFSQQGTTLGTVLREAGSDEALDAAIRAVFQLSGDLLERAHTSCARHAVVNAGAERNPLFGAGMATMAWMLFLQAWVLGRHHKLQIQALGPKVVEDVAVQRANLVTKEEALAEFARRAEDAARQDRIVLEQRLRSEFAQERTSWNEKMDNLRAAMDRDGDKLSQRVEEAERNAIFSAERQGKVQEELQTFWIGEGTTTGWKFGAELMAQAFNWARHPGARMEMNRHLVADISMIRGYVADGSKWADILGTAQACWDNEAEAHKLEGPDAFSVQSLTHRPHQKNMWASLLVWYARLVRFAEYLENEHSSSLALELHKRVAEAEAKVELIQHELDQARAVGLRAKKAEKVAEKRQHVKMPLSALGKKEDDET